MPTSARYTRIEEHETRWETWADTADLDNPLAEHRPMAAVHLSNLATARPKEASRSASLGANPSKATAHRRGGRRPGSPWRNTPELAGGPGEAALPLLPPGSGATRSAGSVDLFA